MADGRRDIETCLQQHSNLSEHCQPFVVFVIPEVRNSTCSKAKSTTMRKQESRKADDQASAELSGN
jgi:hypothetical protein